MRLRAMVHAIARFRVLTDALRMYAVLALLIAHGNNGVGNSIMPLGHALYSGIESCGVILLSLAQVHRGMVAPCGNVCGRFIVLISS